MKESFRRISASDDEYLTFLTARALGFFGPLAREAIPVLALGLKQPHDGWTLNSILDALIWVDPSGESVARAMASALELAGKESRLLFLETFASLGPRGRAEVAEIVKLLTSKDHEVRQAAAHALGRVGSGAGVAVPRLAALLRDDQPQVKLAALQSLGQIGTSGKVATPELLQEIRRVADPGNPDSAVALVRLDPQFQTTADRLAQASEDIYFRAVVQGALGHDTFEGQALTRLTTCGLDPTLATQRGHHNVSGVPNPLLSALGDLERLGAGTRSALPWVSQARTNTDPRVRRAAELTYSRIENNPSKK